MEEGTRGGEGRCGGKTRKIESEHSQNWDKGEGGRGCEGGKGGCSTESEMQCGEINSNQVDRHDGTARMRTTRACIWQRSF